MLRRQLGLMIAAAGMLLLPATAYAQTIAYDVPTAWAGNQGFPGNLGLDFDVNQPIIITSLGAFDNNGDGFTGTVNVAIFNRDTGLQVGGSASFTGTAGTLINGDRFQTVQSFVLPTGHYSVVAVGFNNTDLNGNSTVPGFVASTENSGGGLISFVGSGRYDSNTTLDFPGTVPPGLPTNVFDAGTFQFSAISAPILTKAFGTPSGTINQGDTVPLTFTLTNPNAIPLTGIAVSDLLPPGLMIQNPNGATGSGPCNLTNMGVVTALPGSRLISVSGGTIAANSTCTATINVTGVAQGSQNNVTSTVTSNEAPPGAPATASVFVYPWWLWFFY